MIEPAGLAVLSASGRTVASLDAETVILRTELVALREKMSRMQHEFDHARITDLREANEKLVVTAMHAQAIADIAIRNLDDIALSSRRDVLTSTFNRPEMRERLDDAIKTAGRSKTRLAALFVDLDQFKAINDTLGQATGDQAMKIIARRLEASVRQTDTVSRHGGDEFLVLLSPIAQPADAALIAAKINATLAAPAQLGEQTLHLSASIGIALYPDDGLDAETLISRSDSAMYRSKRKGLGSFAFYADRWNDLNAIHRLEPTPSPPAPSVTFGGLRDVIEANERLTVAAVEAQEAGARAEETQLNQIKFMAMVAHELRDPLTPIRTAAELLLRTGNDPVMLAKVREILRRQVDHISRLVEDLLDGSRASVGKFHLQTAPVDLIKLLNLAVETSRPAMKARVQKLNLAFADAPLSMQGDPVRLVQIFINLLDNASKYTPEGGEIALCALAEDDEIVVTVSDDGIGIMPESLTHVFDLFVQEPGGRARRSGGLGIGLAVVRELAEAHGGTVTARSRGRGLGSEFVVRLPSAAPL